MEELRFSEYCANCRKSLEDIERVLFVEKEVGRCFCTEDCIREYFQPTVEFMNEELSKLRSEGDFHEVDAPKFAHYRSLTLEDPDEIWIEKTESGERHYTFISHFRYAEEHFSYIVVCLTIEGVPSFVFSGFATRDDDLVDEYRRGIDLRRTEELAQPPPGAFDAESASEEGLSSEVNESAEASESEAPVFERLYGDLRQPGDIPREDFEKFEDFVEVTVDEPDEIWTLVDDDKNKWFTFITKNIISGEDEDLNDDEDDDGGGVPNHFYMIVVCRADTFEVVFAVPTIDPGLVQHFRKGINSLNRSFGVGWARGGRAA